MRFAFRFLVLVLIILLVFGLGCSREVSETVTEEVEAVGETEAEIEEAEEELAEAEEVAESDPVPQEIQDLIDEADDLYAQGLYSEANKAYRNAVLAVEDEDMEGKEELLADLEAKFEETRQIVDTARTHHGNAMKLQYEKRFEEAIEELEMALEIYPKYQPAIDALDTLKSLAGLQ
ncbi:MAG: hypothetical protein K9H14_04960 [Actinomycetia bacterium]|nr:hypothetical protein [Actinomycetes bacterium]